MHDRHGGGESMRALTLTQPWATLVALGAKRYETRSWWTAHRGPLAIHAAKGFPREARALCYEEPFKTALGGRAPADLPLGAVVAAVTAEGCVSTGDLDFWPPIREIAFGNWNDGRWAWALDNLVPMATPIPCRGTLGLWRVPEDVEHAIAAQLDGVAP
jgi:hypothetical protein